jgi:hypothetical protein
MRSTIAPTVDYRNVPSNCYRMMDYFKGVSVRISIAHEIVSKFEALLSDWLLRYYSTQNHMDVRKRKAHRRDKLLINVFRACG